MEAMVAAYGTSPGHGSPKGCLPTGLWGRAVLPKLWSLLAERPRVRATPNSAGPPAGVNGKSYPGIGRCPRSAHGESWHKWR